MNLIDSPHRPQVIETNIFNLTEDDQLLINEEAHSSNNCLNNQIFKATHSLNILMWNSKGATKKNYSESRKLVTQALITDVHCDLFIIQEPIYKNRQNYLTNFNVNINGSFELLFPPKSNTEVAIVYNLKSFKNNIKIIDSYALIEESKTYVNYETLFEKHGKKRVQITHFTTNLDKEICFINFHSVYNNYKKEKKIEFIVEFFKFSYWYSNSKCNGVKTLIAGDFNSNILEEIVDKLFDDHNIQISVCKPPALDDYNSNSTEISPTNIDFFCTFKKENLSVNISCLKKVPVRTQEYYGNNNGNIFISMAKNFVSRNQLSFDKVSTHDPFFGKLFLGTTDEYYQSFKTNPIFCMNET